MVVWMDQGANEAQSRLGLRLSSSKGYNLSSLEVVKIESLSIYEEVLK